MTKGLELATDKKSIFLFLLIYIYKTRENFVICFSEVQRKIGAELVFNAIVGWNLEYHLFFCIQNSLHNATRDEFGTSHSMNFRNAIILIQSYQWLKIYFVILGLN